MLVQAGHLESQGGGEILFVADHDIDQGGDATVDGHGALDAALRFPKRSAEVEVVGDDGSGGARGFHGLDDEVGGGGGERGEDTAAVEPADPLLFKEPLPIHVAGASCEAADQPRSEQPTAPRRP
jgi:hypothetical protein